MPHDFNAFPELTNAQMNYYYWESPHKQMFGEFWARVVRVHDADTIIVTNDQRTFEFPIRLNNASARELVETPKRDTSHQLCASGKDAQKWLEGRLLGEEVLVSLSRGRVEKWGRLLGRIIHKGVDVGLELQWHGQSLPWERRFDGEIPTLKEVKI